MTQTPFLRMAQNNAWANETFHAALAALPQGGLTAPNVGFFPSLAQTLNHILTVDRFYFAALAGRPLPYAMLEAPDITDRAALAAAQGAEDLRLIAFCRDLDGAKLAQSVATIRGDLRIPERVEDLLLHLFQHQIHHRGQAHVQLQHLGVAPPQLDDFHLAFGRVPRAEHWRGA
jgi:uncharacterized damage-inducible protein DinB